jgi:starvation-inducible outer membrane lipoprotein
MLKLALAGLALLSLSACASLPGGGQDSAATAKLLENLRHCDRTYIGSLGGLAPPVAQVSIKCAAQPVEAAPSP